MVIGTGSVATSSSALAVIMCLRLFGAFRRVEIAFFFILRHNWQRSAARPLRRRGGLFEAVALHSYLAASAVSRAGRVWPFFKLREENFGA